MRVLVTGRYGFVGRHMAVVLREAGHETLGFDIRAPETDAEPYFRGDLRNPSDLGEALRSLRPEACVHLGGMAHVPASWDHPAEALAVNALGTVHLLDAFRSRVPEARMVVAGSAEVYGSFDAERLLNEEHPFAPANPYALSKAAADQMARLYAARYDCRVCVARPVNHIGPGQDRGFVAAAFALQLASIALRKAPPLLRVGNLDSRRDFTDVRDVARAYLLLLEKGVAGRAYHIATGKPVPVRRLLDALCAASGLNPRMEIDPARYRPADHQPGLDTGLIERDTGWKPLIPLEQTLADLYAEALAQVGSEAS